MTARIDVKHRRRFPRRRIAKPARIICDPRQAPQRCLIQDISFEGARLRVENSAVFPAYFRLFVSDDNIMYEAEVRWRSGCELGVRFTKPGFIVVGRQESAAAPAMSGEVWVVD